MLNNVINDMFNIEKCKYLVDMYTLTSGIDCILIDKKGEIIYSNTSSGNICPFCMLLKDEMDDFPGCRNVHLYGAYQSQRFGGKYVFFCQSGLTHWASPIMIDGILEGALLGGPVIMTEHEEFFEEDIKNNLNINKNKLYNIKNELQKIPFVDSKKVHAFSETLFLYAKQLSDTTGFDNDKNEKKQNIQNNISSYIHSYKKRSMTKYPMEKEKDLLSAIKLGDKAKAQRLINEIFGYVYFSSGNDFDVIKARSIELLVLLSRASVEGGAEVEQIFGINHRYIKEIDTIDNIEELTDCFIDIMARFTDLVFNLKDVKHADTMYKALSYIKKNYMKKISLEDVAYEVYLSPSYFSKIFKQEMKSNFNTYLNNYRIEASKNLLKDDDMELVEVANLVGYEDQSYFSKVFKKKTGISPGKYRSKKTS